jgi:tRNA(adenine34) deaminase
MVERSRWLEEALRLAGAAARHGEVPVGAVVVRDGRVLGARHNETISQRSALAHAELLALSDAMSAVGEGYLVGADVYVSLEPCAMCAGALVLARVRSLTFGAWDPKGGGCGSLMNIVSDPRLNHELEMVRCVADDRASALLRRFFAERRGGPRT